MCGGVLPPSTHTRTHSDCVSLSGPDGPTRSVKHPSDLCVKSVTRGHLFWTQQLAAPSQHNSSNGYVGDRRSWWGAAEEEEAAAATGQIEMMKQTMNQGTREHHRSSKPRAGFEGSPRLVWPCWDVLLLVEERETAAEVLSPTEWDIPAPPQSFAIKS